MNAASRLFHIDSFFFTCSSPFTSLPALETLPEKKKKNDPNEVTCTKNKHKMKEKNIVFLKKNSQKVQNVSRWRWRRTRFMIRWAWKRHQKKQKWRDGGGGRWHFFKNRIKVFVWRHGDMLGKRWANRHGGWVALKGGKKKTGERRELTHKRARAPHHYNISVKTKKKKQQTATTTMQTGRTATPFTDFISISLPL